MKTATHIKKLTEFNGNAAFYLLDPPLSDSEGNQHSYVAVSAITTLGGPETYIFPTDETGIVTSWLELEGSQRGTLLHEDALRDAGYTVK